MKSIMNLQGRSLLRRKFACDLVRYKQFHFRDTSSQLKRTPALTGPFKKLSGTICTTRPPQRHPIFGSPVIPSGIFKCNSTSVPIRRAESVSSKTPRSEISTDSALCSWPEDSQKRKLRGILKLRRRVKRRSVFIAFTMAPLRRQASDLRATELLCLLGPVFAPRHTRLRFADLSFATATKRPADSHTPTSLTHAITICSS